MTKITNIEIAAIRTNDETEDFMVELRCSEGLRSEGVGKSISVAFTRGVTMLLTMSRHRKSLAEDHTSQWLREVIEKESGGKPNPGTVDYVRLLRRVTMVAQNEKIEGDEIRAALMDIVVGADHSTIDDDNFIEFAFIRGQRSMARRMISDALAVLEGPEFDSAALIGVIEDTRVQLGMLARDLDCKPYDPSLHPADVVSSIIAPKVRELLGPTDA